MGEWAWMLYRIGQTDFATDYFTLFVMELATLSDACYPPPLPSHQSLALLERLGRIIEMVQRLTEGTTH